MNQHRNLLYLLIAASCLARLITPHWVNPMSFLYMGAPAMQWRAALAPLDTFSLSAIDPFFYPLWLSAVAKITLGLPGPVACYAGLLSVLTPWLWYRFMREALPSKDAALLGWAILGWLPSWIGIYSYFMPETVLLPLVGASLWMTWRSFRKNTFESFVWATLLWLLSCLTKMTVAPLAILAIGRLIWTASDRIQRLAVVGGMILACAIPLGYRAHRILGVWAPFGYPMHNRIYMVSGAESLHLQMSREGRMVEEYRFTSGSMTSRPLSPLSTWQTSRRGVCDVVIRLDHGSEDWKSAFQQNKGSLARRWRMRMENVLFTLVGPSWPDLDTRRFWDRLTYQSRWIWAPLLLGIILVQVRTARRQSLSFLSLITLTGWLCIIGQGVAPSEGRYRKPFEGLLIATALGMIYAKKESPSH